MKESIASAAVGILSPILAWVVKIRLDFILLDF